MSLELKNWSYDVVDAAKRKTLPAWIREGLEKMEREKQKKLEKEQREKELEAAKQARAEAEREAEEALRAEKEGYDAGPRVPRKSKFVSIEFKCYYLRQMFYNILRALIVNFIKVKNRYCVNYL